MSDDNKEQYTDEEYHFAIDPEGEDEILTESVEPQQASIHEKSFKFDKQSIMKFFADNIPARNALIAVGVLIVIIFMYQFTMSLMSKSKASKTDQSIIVSDTKDALVTKNIPSNYIPTNTNQMSESIQSEKIVKKLAIVEQNQNSLKSQFSAINSQNSGLNSNLNVLLEKMSTLSRQVQELSSTVEEQSKVIMRLNQKAQARATVVKPKIRVQPRQYLKYNVQAVIPGRAWLIATNGSTLTVRKGTLIPGYGMVRIIDTMQGRVLTSSGQVIKFSQEDS